MKTEILIFDYFEFQSQIRLICSSFLNNKLQFSNNNNLNQSTPNKAVF